MKFDATQQAEFGGQIARHQAVLHAYNISLMSGINGIDEVSLGKRKSFEPGTNFQTCSDDDQETPKTHPERSLNSFT